MGKPRCKDKKCIQQALQVAIQDDFDSLALVGVREDGDAIAGFVHMDSRTLVRMISVLQDRLIELIDEDAEIAEAKPEGKPEEKGSVQ